MKTIAAALLVALSGKEVTEDAIKKVLSSVGAKVNDASQAATVYNDRLVTVCPRLTRRRILALDRERNICNTEKVFVCSIHDLVRELVRAAGLHKANGIDSLACVGSRHGVGKPSDRCNLDRRSCRR